MGRLEWTPMVFRSVLRRQLEQLATAGTAFAGSWNQSDLAAPQPRKITSSLKDTLQPRKITLDPEPKNYPLPKKIATNLEIPLDPKPKNAPLPKKIPSNPEIPLPL